MVREMRFISVQTCNVLFFLIFYCAFPQIVTAKMYKWIDENGNTHYTQTPPSGDIQAIEISPPPRVDTSEAQKKLESQIEQADKYQSDRYKQLELEEKEQKLAADKEARCMSARASQASFERPRVNYVNEDGSRRIMEEEERLASLEKAKAQVKEACE